ncbi:ComF family protein [Sphingobium subterraneum]|uniref:ComF family protein n=1 Tax=Sphingobium subterraneum TaxID=627688 RepID=A0A841IV86_9SPHN|nr:ComF family protein [Sphingobium subterraneum]MBB6122587.1 ComF family protein [Sphingobium subterraneum]
MTLATTLVRIARPLVDYALPPRCPGCGAIVQEDHSFCLSCWQGMRLLGAPCCACCGAPFEWDEGEGALCGPCIESPPAFDSARAVMAYGDVARTVAMRLKYGRRTGLARLMGKHMARLLPEGEDAPRVIIPVPLHRWRLWSRGFNQSALIADDLARRTGLPVDKLVLVRSRPTRPLRQMSPVQRAKTVRGAFSVDPRRSASIRGRSVVLIDDIHTTGSTAQECVRTLQKAGARSVHLICWARVLAEHTHEWEGPGR